ncbi:MAG: hypothetical protein H0W14_13345 [Actinobacteria bacterium]|nr:hypothetical protein [Actinomycetota bacterium]
MRVIRVTVTGSARSWRCIWAHASLDGIVAAYAQTKPTSPEDARRLWEGG